MRSPNLLAPLRKVLVYSPRRWLVQWHSNGNGILASGSRAQAGVCHQQQQKRGILFNVMGNQKPGRVEGYYVVYPEIPDETPENNLFLSNIARNENWPAVATATPKEMYEGTIRLLMEYGATQFDHLRNFDSDKSVETTFDNTLLPLLSEEYDVDYAFNTLMMKMLTDWPECSRAALQKDVYHATILYGNTVSCKIRYKELQEAMQHMYDNREDLQKSDQLDNWRVRLIEWYLAEVRSSTVSMRDEKTIKFLNSSDIRLGGFEGQYLTNIAYTNEEAVHNVASRSHLKFAPPHILKFLAGTNDPNLGPWRGLMDPKSIYSLLKYCGDRPTRRAAWDSWVSRASFATGIRRNNSVIIEEMRHHNQALVKPLGFNTIAEHRLHNTMAGSPQTVRDFVSELVDRIRPVFLDRLQSWSTYAATKELITGELKPYDLFYICPREGEDHYNVDTLDLMNHFPFWQTFENTIEVVSHLLNLSFQDVTDSGLERCHPSVRIFSVSDKSADQHLGHLYVDPFERWNKKTRDWQALLGRPKNQTRHLDTIVYLIGRASEPDASGESLLHYTQLQSMLFAFGRAVQYLLSRAPYREIVIPAFARYASASDAIDMFPTFVQFFLNKPNLLLALSSPHKITGESLAKKVDATSLAFSRSAVWETYRTLFWTDFDLTICEMETRRDAFWLDLYKDMYKEYFPFKREDNNFQPCSFTPIFGGRPLLGMYYRKLWAEMLALDVHDTFSRESNERSTGERLKTMILNAGDGDIQSLLYNKFQGRDPSIGPICDFYDPPASESSEISQEAKSVG